MRGAVLPHVTSQHYVFSYKINEGQGQRSSSVEINIITKIPYYRPLEEREKLRLNEEAREKKVIFLG